MNRQLWALAQMLETGHAAVSPETYFRLRSEVLDDPIARMHDPAKGVYTPFGPVQIIVVRSYPDDGFMYPSNEQGAPIIGLPASFPVHGAPDDWPRDWRLQLNHLQYEIRRGHL